MADIPPRLLAQLNRGELEAITLVEGLAIDQSQLLTHVARELLPAPPPAPDLVGLGILERMRTIAGHWRAWADSDRRGDAVLAQLAAHRSDTVRGWACLAVVDDDRLDLQERLRRARRFAADPHMGVREWAWMAARSAIAAQLPAAIGALQHWVEDPDPSVRRFAIEATRPRGVWTKQIKALVDDPELGRPLLEPLRAESERYPATSVANWINDAAKSQPSWAKRLIARWRKESPTKATAWIAGRALRSLKSAR